MLNKLLGPLAVEYSLFICHHDTSTNAQMGFSCNPRTYVHKIQNDGIAAQKLI